MASKSAPKRRGRPPKSASKKPGPGPANPFGVSRSSLKFAREQIMWDTTLELWRLGSLGNGPAQQWGDMINETALQLLAKGKKLVLQGSRDSKLEELAILFYRQHKNNLDGFDTLQRLSDLMLDESDDSSSSSGNSSDGSDDT